MTECKEVGYKKIPGANHAHPTYHYEMMPGEAYTVHAETGEWVVTKVDKATAAQAEQAFNLHFVKGRTVAEFVVGETQYAQPIPLKGEAKIAAEKAEKRQIKKEKSIVAQAREEKAVKVEPPPAPKAEPKQGPKKDPPPKRAKGLRKGGYGLD